MNIRKITPKTEDRIERYATIASQRLLHRAIEQFNSFFVKEESVLLPRFGYEIARGGCMGAIRAIGVAYWGYNWEEFRALIMQGCFGVRMGRIMLRAEALERAIEHVMEARGCRDAESHADYAMWAGEREARDDWEARHLEKWQGD